MATAGTVKLAKIWKMLDACAVGYSVKTTDHRYLISWRGARYSLPQGAHGKKQEIEIGHVKRLVEALGLDIDCVLRHCLSFEVD